MPLLFMYDVSPVDRYDTIGNDISNQSCHVRYVFTCGSLT